MAFRRYALVGSFRPYRGGIADFSESHCLVLGQRGHMVLPVTLKCWYPAQFIAGKAQREPGHVAGTAKARRWLDTINPVIWELVAWRVAGCGKVEFQHRMAHMAVAAGFVARWTNGRVLVMVHNVGGHQKRTGNRLLARMLLGAAQGYGVTNHSVQRDIAVRAPVLLAPHPVYEYFGNAPDKTAARQALALAMNAPVLLLFGIVLRYKGLETLLRNLPRAIEALPRLLLVVAGEFYEDPGPYNSLLDSPGIWQHVDVEARYISIADVGKYFRAANVVVQPYESAMQSGVAQVAFHLGTPVIATDVGGLAEVVPHGNAGLVVPPTDPAARSEAIVQPFSEGLGATLEEGVRRERQRFGWDRVCEALESHC